MREFDGQLLRSTAERYCALGVSRGDPLPPPVPPPALTVDEPNRQRLIAELNLPTDVPVVALCPGAAFGSSKRWPVARFGSIAKEMVRRGFAVWVIGSPGEAPLGAAITEHEPSALDLCGKSTLIDAVDLLSMADVTVTNDSGLLHIAAAVGSHVVALYGSTPPWFAPPLTSRHSVHYAGLECSPCFKRECPLGHHNCMGFIAPDVIANKVVEVLEARL